MTLTTKTSGIINEKMPDIHSVCGEMKILAKTIRLSPIRNLKIIFKLMLQELLLVTSYKHTI